MLTGMDHRPEPSHSECRFDLHPSAAWRQIDGHVFIITPDSRQHELDGPVERAVWALLAAGPKSLSEITASIVAEFDVAAEQAEIDLGSFLIHLLDAGIVAEISE